MSEVSTSDFHNQTRKSETAVVTLNNDARTIVNNTIFRDVFLVFFLNFYFVFQEKFMFPYAYLYTMQTFVFK